MNVELSSRDGIGGLEVVYRGIPEWKTEMPCNADEDSHVDGTEDVFIRCSSMILFMLETSLGPLTHNS